MLGRVAFLGRIASLLRRVVAALRGRLLSVSHLRTGLVVVALGRRGAVLGTAIGRLGLLRAAVLGGLVLLAGHGGGEDSGWGGFGAV